MDAKPPPHPGQRHPHCQEPLLSRLPHAFPMLGACHINEYVAQVVGWPRWRESSLALKTQPLLTSSPQERGTLLVHLADVAREVICRNLLRRSPRSETTPRFCACPLVRIRGANILDCWPCAKAMSCWPLHRRSRALPADRHRHSPAGAEVANCPAANVTTARSCARCVSETPHAFAHFRTHATTLATLMVTMFLVFALFLASLPRPLSLSLSLSLYLSIALSFALPLIVSSRHRG